MNVLDPKSKSDSDAIANAPDAAITGSLGHIPVELLLTVCSNLDSAKDIVSLGATCRKLHQITNDDEEIWRSLFQAHFPHTKASNSFPAGNGYLKLYKDLLNFEGNVKSGRYTQRLLRGHEGMVYCAKATGNRLCTGSADETIKVWDLATGECVQTLKGHRKAIAYLQIVGNLLYSCSEDKTVKIWDLTKGECLHTLEGHQNGIYYLKVVGDRLLTYSRDMTVKFWNIDSGECLQTIENYEINLTPFNLVGNCHYALTTSADGTVAIWDISTGECLQTIEGYENRTCRLQGIGNGFYARSYNDAVKIWDIATGECLHTLEGHKDTVRCLQVVGNRLYTGAYDETIKIWDITTGECLQTLIGHKSEVKFLQVIGNCLYASSYDHLIKVWDITTGECLQIIDEGNPPPEFAALIGYRLVTASLDHTIKVRDFGFPCLSSYPLQLLEEALSVLGKMAHHEHRREHEILQGIAKKLYPDFKRRLEEYCHDAAPASSLSKEAILHVQAEVCIEILLHAVHDENQKKVDEILAQLQFIDHRHTAALYELLWSECGKPFVPQWGEHAFHDANGYRVPIHSKIEAVLKFQQVLKSSSAAVS